jgi:ketosteroid isomerase-like protein
MTDMASPFANSHKTNAITARAVGRVSSKTRKTTMKRLFAVFAALFLLVGQLPATDVTVTQATSPTTAVTANGDSGLITTFNETLAAATSLTFTVNNAAVDADSVILVCIDNYSGTYVTNGIPVVSVNNMVAGTSFDIKLTNVHAANALSGTLKIGFKLH